MKSLKENNLTKYVRVYIVGEEIEEYNNGLNNLGRFSPKIINEFEVTKLAHSSNNQLYITYFVYLDKVPIGRIQKSKDLYYYKFNNNQSHYASPVLIDLYKMKEVNDEFAANLEKERVKRLKIIKNSTDVLKIFFNTIDFKWNPCVKGLVHKGPHVHIEFIRKGEETTIIDILVYDARSSRRIGSIDIADPKFEDELRTLCHNIMNFDKIMFGMENNKLLPK